MSSISLADLESAAAAIIEIGRDEITFDVMGTEVTLRTLYPDEEIECQRFASETYEEGDPKNSATTLDYFDQFRIVALSTALVALGNLDLRGVEFIETGEQLENGQAIKVPKTQAMRKVLRQWGRTIQIGMFDKHFELTDRMEAKAEKAISFDPADTQAEITRLKARVGELEDQIIRRQSQNKNLFKGIHQAVKDHGHLSQDVKKSVLNEELEEDPAPAPAPAPAPESPPIEAGVANHVNRSDNVHPPSQYREPAPQPQVQGSIVPPSVAPPPASGAQAPVRAQAQPPAQQQAAQQQAPQQQAGIIGHDPSTDPLAGVRSSFLDPDDEGGMEAAMIEETKRFYASRQQAQAGVPVNDGSVLTQMRQGPQGGPVPPHVAAHQLNQGLKNDGEYQRQEEEWQQAVQAEALQTAALQAQALRAQALQANDASNLKQAQMGKEQVDGKSVHRLPPEPLETRRAKGPNQVATDPRHAGTRNPRFQQPKP